MWKARAITGKTFQPKNKIAEGSSLEQQPLSTEANQQYEFAQIKNDVYIIKLKGTELYVTPGDKNGSTNSEIILEKKIDGPLQQWTIYIQHPEI
jgi:hypothetical protein